MKGLWHCTKSIPILPLVTVSLNGPNYNLWGLPLGTNSRNTDNQAIGQTYIDLYLMNRYKEERIRNIRTCIDNMLATDKTDDWNWIDDLRWQCRSMQDLAISIMMKNISTE